MGNGMFKRKMDIKLPGSETKYPNIAQPLDLAGPFFVTDYL
jgi:hypothetical protein